MIKAKVKKHASLILLLSLTVLTKQVYGIETFTDVKEGTWYYNDVMKAKKNNIINGYEDNTFKPNNKVKKIEAVKIALESRGSFEIYGIKEKNWYDKYLIRGNGLGIELKEEDINDFATRQDVAEYIVRANYNQLDDNLDSIKDEVYDTDNKYILQLFKKGVIKGSEKIDGKTKTNPNNSVTRAEIAAMVNRSVDIKYLNNFKEERKKEANKIQEQMQKEQEKEVEKKKNNKSISMYNDLMKNKVIIPKTVQEYKAEIIDMISNKEFKRAIRLGPNASKDILDSEVKNITTAFKEVYNEYPEYGSYVNRIACNKTNSREGDVELNIFLVSTMKTENNIDKEQMIEDFEKEAEKLVNNLIKDGKINNDNSEYEKAKVLYNWVVDNTHYGKETYLESYTGYGQLIKKEAVCQGFVSSYNYLLRKVGIKDVKGVAGISKSNGRQDKHIWTKAILDGKEVIIDPTFGNTGGNREAYFDIPQERVNQLYGKPT